MTRAVSFRRLLNLTLTAATVAVLAGSAQPARAQGTTPMIGDQPAATLLLPYFEVDLENPAGANTLFSINNASASAILAHATVWSAMHVPVLTFDVYLTGYDMQTINLRDVINGVLPRTATDGQDPLEVISNQGPISQDINFASCNSVLPPTTLPTSTVNHVRAALTGQQSPLTGQCSSLSDGTLVARGYVTVDTVNQCTSATPATAGYFVNGGGGIATNQNVMWGDAVYVNHLGGQEASDGSPLVHIRAFPGVGVAGVQNRVDDLAQTTVAGEYTFYGRLVAWSAADNREPLSSIFMARFANSAPAQTTLTVWRDPKMPQAEFSCASRPAWYPLAATQVVAFDEQERPQSLLTDAQSPFSPLVDTTRTPFSAGVQRVRVGGSDLPTTYASGVLYVNLNTVVTPGSNPPEDPTLAQGWVSVHTKGGPGWYSVGSPATQLESARQTNWTFLPVP